MNFLWTFSHCKILPYFYFCVDNSSNEYEKGIIIDDGNTHDIVSFAEEVNLAEVDPTTWPGPNKAPTLLPQVFIDGEELSVLSPYVIDPAQIIIRDVNDDIIYNVYAILPASTYMMILPAEVNAAKYKIELIYGDHHLVGYF